MALSKARAAALIPTGYVLLLAELKARVRAAQVKAAMSVNRELILLWWHIEREILRAQKAEGWGAKVVERPAMDLAAELPEMGGFSRTNILRMRAFYAAWEPLEIVPRPVGQLGDVEVGSSIVPRAVGQLRKGTVRQLARPIVSQLVIQLDEPPEPLALLPWSTNLILLEKLKDPATRLWYARKTLEHGWSRAVLTVQIESRLHERSGNRVKVEYALREVKKPIGVAEWQTRLVDSLPKKLRGSLPTIADIERELNKPLPTKPTGKRKHSS